MLNVLLPSMKRKEDAKRQSNASACFKIKQCANFIYIKKRVLERNESGCLANLQCIVRLPLRKSLIKERVITLRSHRQVVFFSTTTGCRDF